MQAKKVHITETARDAMQGIENFIPTQDKIQYINLLLRAGFDTVDCGSFVSPRIIPQMADSAVVISQLDFPDNRPEIMALAVNEKGVEKALENEQINCLCYPFSVSPTFLKRNLNSDEKHALRTIDRMQAIGQRRKLNWVIYLSMGLGNPYGDDWSLGLISDTAGMLIEKGFKRLPLSDILGEAKPDIIYNTFKMLNNSFPECDFGLHLHTRPSETFQKLDAAWEAGVRSFETVLGGLGGCPTAASEMVGNLNTRTLLHFLKLKNYPYPIDDEILHEAEIKSASFVVQ